MTHTKKKPFFLLATGILLVLSILMGFIGVNSLHARAESKSLAGSGTEEDPYIITNSVEFSNLFSSDDYSVLGYYKLANDIDFYDSYWNPKVERFHGTLDGNGKAIKRLKIKVNSSGNYGLIKHLSGTVKNLTIDNFTITTNATVSSEETTCVGALAGESNVANIINCTVKNSSIDISGIKSMSFVGGFIGYADHGRVENCIFGEKDKVEQTSVCGNNYVGGFIGLDLALTVKDCINYGSVRCNYAEGLNPYVGGIAGGQTYRAVIYNSCNVGNIKYIGAANDDKNFKPRMGQLLGANGTNCEFDTEYNTNVGKVSSCRGKVDRGNLRKVGGFLGMGKSDQAEFVSDSFAGEYIY